MHKKTINLSSFALHIIAMLLMLCDHLWGTVLYPYDWLTWIGRLSFPIFAFLIVEGYFHTHDYKRYMLRLLSFAVIAELPFNLMYSLNVFYPFHQNVLWTFLIALAAIWLIEKAQRLKYRWLAYLVAVGVSCAAYLLATVAMCDYYGPGVLTVLAFYFFRGEKVWQRLGQLGALIWINFKLLAGLNVAVSLFGYEFLWPQQGTAVLSLILIWLYHGRQGPHNKWIQYSYYAFYPVHALILALLVLAI